MLILLEGVDGSGKTTLATTLHDEYGYETVVPPIPSAYYYDDWNTLIKANKNQVVICDRSFLTELVYRAIDDKISCIKLPEALSLIKNCKVIYCNTYDSFEYSMKRGEDNITTEDAHKDIKDLYESLMDVLMEINGSKIMYYDWNLMSIRQVIKFINAA